MGKASRDGYYAEKKVVEYLNQTKQLLTERYGHQGPADKADIRGLRQSCIDSKNRVGWALSTWLNRADQQAINAGARIPWVVKPQKGKSVDDWYFMLKGRNARAIIALLETIPDEQLETFFSTLPVPKQRKQPVAKT